MTFGPTTDLFQIALRTLLQGRQPSPLAPATLPPVSTPVISAPIPSGGFTPPGGFIPPPLGSPPEPAPIAPLPARDESLIEQLTGPRPVAPVEQPDSLLQKISRALIGFGAGTQGYGPQYLAGLREERERPQREFRAATEQYEANRRRALEVAEDKRTREQERIQRRADEQSEREFRQWVQRTGVQDQMALEQMRQAFDLEKLRQAERAADEKLALQQKALDDRQRRAFEYQLVREDDAPSKIAREISDYVFTGKPMSPAAENWRSLRAQTAQARLGRLSGSGGGGRGASVNAKAEHARQQFEAVKQQVADAEQRGDTTGAEQLRKKMINIHNSLTRFGATFELGYGDREGRWPYAKYRGEGAQPQGAPAPGQQREQMYFDLRGGGPSVGPGAQQQQAGPSDAEVQAYAQAYDVTPEVARQELKEMRGQR